MHGFTAGHRNSTCPKRVVGAGHEHFVAFIEKRLHSRYNKFAYAVARVDIVNGFARNIFLFAISENRFSGIEQALGIAVALRIHNAFNESFVNLLGCAEAVNGGVAYVKPQNIYTACHHFLRFLHNGAAYTVGYFAESFSSIEIFHNFLQNK